MGVSTDAHLIYGWKVPEWEEQSDRPIPEPNKYGDYTEDLDSIGEGTPYEMVRHCHIDFPEWIFGFRATQAKAWRGEPIAVTKELAAQPTAEEVAAARAWAAENGVPIVEGEPRYEREEGFSED